MEGRRGVGRGERRGVGRGRKEGSREWKEGGE